MEKKIFVSVGRNGTPAQEAFVGAIRDRLRGAGLLPCTVGQDYWTDKAPLKGVTELMTECTGAVIIALERSYFPEGIERRDHPTAKRQLRDIKLTTPFNQVETALAYAHGHPLLVIVETGVREEGLLEDKHGWHIQRVEPTAASLTTQEFNGVFERWKDRVETKSKKLEEAMKNKENGIEETKDKLDDDLSKWTLKQWWEHLKPAHLASIGTALAVLLSGAFSLGVMLSGGSGAKLLGGL